MKPRALLLATLLLATFLLPGDAAAEPHETLAILSTSQAAWTMLKLETLEEGAPLRVQMIQGQAACPMVWGHHLLGGSPTDFHGIGGARFTYHHGEHGVELETEEPAHVQVERVEGGSGRDCSPANLMLLFRPPVGVSYLLGFHAGAPIDGRSFVTAPAGAIRVLGVSQGNDTFYLHASDYREGTWARAAAPGVAPEEDTPGWPSQSWVPAGYVGASLSLERRAAATFHHHPYLMMSTPEDGVRALRVTDPDGRVHQNEGVRLRTANLNAGLPIDPTARWIEIADNAPPGRYLLEVEWAVHAARFGVSGVPAWGIDFRFPEEV